MVDLIFKIKGNHRSANAILPDACAFALVLLLFGFTFYLNWDFWDDQAAQAYMAWGLFHGMRPYVDLVDPNWPGILLPHALAYLIAGTSAWGLRALDLLFAYAMLMATSFVLANWGTPLAMRLLAGSAYLTTYFATGWMWTAQRESFCWPLFVIGAIPFLLKLGPRVADSAPRSIGFSSSAWFCFGVVTGMSLWIKPTPILAVITLAVACVWLCDRRERGQVARGIAWHGAGIIALSILILIALTAFGELSGFLKWGIRYDFGPYAQVKFPWPVRLHMMYRFFTDPRLRQVAIVVAIVGGVVAATWPRRLRRWNKPARPVAVSIALVIAGALAVFAQGKPGSLYHFIPLTWALAFCAATVWSVVPWTNITRGLAWALAIFLVGLTLVKEPRNAGTTAGTIAGRRLNALLAPNDEIVEWGYSPSLLLQAQRRTPFMPFIGTAFLITSPKESWAAHEIVDRLNAALRDASVRYLLVEQLPNYKIQADTPKLPIDYLQQNPTLRKTLSDQYQPLPQSTLSGFTVFAHTSTVERHGNLD